MTSSEAARQFRTARDLLLAHRSDPEAARGAFQWPRTEQFNWASDWFDQIAPNNGAIAVHTIAENGDTRQLTYSALAQRSQQVANWFIRQGLGRNSRLLVMLGNRPEVWEATIAAIRLGAIVFPTYTSVSGRDLADRIRRGEVTHILTEAAFTEQFTTSHLPRICVDDPPTGWARYADSFGELDTFVPEFATLAKDPLFVYFTSGTTAAPKMVEHTHASYPIGHLVSMFYNGLQPGDVHVNTATPGWAKHAWSSFFGPLNAEATIVSVELSPDRPERLLDVAYQVGATSLCAPPTVWRALTATGIGERPPHLREVTSVGEALNPEVVDRIRRSWGLTIRDGYGQTEATALIGNSPGATVKPGSMGRPLPGYRIALVDPLTGTVGTEGEICVDLHDLPLGLMTGYLGDDKRTADVFADGWYHTGDIARTDADGYITHLGRVDDLFKVSGHQISPFELESVLIEHPLVAEAAVIPTVDPCGGQATKAFLTLIAGVEPSQDTARRILRYATERLAPHQQIAVLEFGELPKTVSGKIRRTQLKTIPLHGPIWHRDQLLTRMTGRLAEAD